MTQSEFELVLNTRYSQSKMEATVFITRTCKVTLYIARVLLMQQDKEGIGRAVYNALPILNKKYLADYTDFKLIININFEYGS